MFDFKTASQELISIGQHLFSLGMAPAASGSFSVRLNNKEIAITDSGKHKASLVEADIIRINSQGKSLVESNSSPKESILHAKLYERFPDVGVVLHAHSVNSTVLSKLCEDWLVIQGYDLLKSFPGINTHDCRVRLPVFYNDQDIELLAEMVDKVLAQHNNPKVKLANKDNIKILPDPFDLPAYMIRGHGFYAWGHDISDAIRHIEALDFLFDCELRLRSGSLNS